MSDTYVFVSGSDLVIPVDSIAEDPVVVPEETVVTAQIANIDLQNNSAQTKPLAAAPTSSASTDQPMDTRDNQNNSQADSPMTVNSTEADKQDVGENMPADGNATEAIEEELIDEDTYIAFGPGGDPGRNKLLGELNDLDEQEEMKGWRGDDDYDSCDSYFEEDFYDGYDDCF